MLTVKLIQSTECELKQLQMLMMMMLVLIFNGLQIAVSKFPVNSSVRQMSVFNDGFLSLLTSLVISRAALLVLRVIILIVVRLIAVRKCVHASVSHVAG